MDRNMSVKTHIENVDGAEKRQKRKTQQEREWKRERIGDKKKW